MIVQIVSGNAGYSGTLSDATGTGWTEIAGSDIRAVNYDRCRATLLYKIAVLSDLSASNYSFTIDSDADNAEGAIVAFSGVDVTSGPFDVTPGNVYTNINSDAQLNATAITTATANSAVIMFGAIDDNYSFSAWSTTDPGSMTELYDLAWDSSLDIGMGASWALKSATGSTGTGIATISSSDYNGSILIALRPAPTPTISSLGSSGGCEGSSLTITGTNLSGATAVTIGGSAAAITANTSTTVTVTVGSGTTGTVQVTTAVGTATSVATFTVNPLPVAAGAISGSSSVCPEQTGVSYTVPTISNADSYIWAYSGTGATINGTGNSITIDFSITATSGNLTVKGHNDCGDGTISTRAITVNSIPVTLGATICQGESGELTSSTACASIDGSVGPNNAGSGIDVTGIGTLTWTNFGNITSSTGNTYATASVNQNITTHYLQGSNYGFNIPGNATIEGITVTINRYTSGSSSPRIRDNRVMLVKSGVIQTGTNYAATTTDWPTSATSTTYG